MYELTRRELLRLAPLGTLATLLAACGGGGESDAAPATPTLDAASPEGKAREFLEAWHADDFDTMYGLLTPEAKQAVSREQFETRYRNVLAEATVYEIETRLVSADRVGDREGAAEFELLYRTRLVGDMQFRARIDLALGDGGDWRVAWTPALIIPELGEVNRLRLFPRTSTRGVIYDRNSQILATQGAIVTIGVVPGQIEDEGALQGVISELSGMKPGEIAEKYAGQPGDWFIPIVDIPFERSQQNYERLVNTPGISLREQAIRSYPKGKSACHLLGFVGRVNAEELAELGERGYEESDYVGKQGIERWAEKTLAGKKGGRLAVLSPEGEEVATLADEPAVQSRSLYTTIDLALQQACEQALGERKGAVVIADVATGEVLGMASWPRFDPTAMSNELDAAQRAAVAGAENLPMMNRATLGAYPSGSLFKILTMIAGMEQAGMPRSSSFNCTGVWNELGVPMACWKESGHGNVNLVSGLEQSCNIVFYETGVKLHNTDPMALQETAATFGIGKPTGIEVDESPGLLPTPEWKQSQMGDVWTIGDTVNLSIGQGFLQVTPAQMLRATLAVAAGGLLRELTIVSRTEDPTGNSEPQPFERAEPAQLPLQGETLNAVRTGMRAVAVPPRGTASGVFGDFPVAIAGKTGTAETRPDRNPHAWFCGYAPHDQPEVAIISMVEYGGEGSGVAAPIARKVLEHYFGLNA